MFLATWLGVAEPVWYAAAKSAMLGRLSGPLFEPAPTNMIYVLTIMLYTANQMYVLLAVGVQLSVSVWGSHCCQVSCKGRALAMQGALQGQVHGRDRWSRPARSCMSHDGMAACLYEVW